MLGYDLTLVFINTRVNTVLVVIIGFIVVVLVLVVSVTISYHSLVASSARRCAVAPSHTGTHGTGYTLGHQ
jgi:hypothetical protein